MARQRPGQGGANQVFATCSSAFIPPEYCGACANKCGSTGERENRPAGFLSRLLPHHPAASSDRTAEITHEGAPIIRGSSHHVGVRTLSRPAARAQFHALGHVGRPTRSFGDSEGAAGTPPSRRAAAFLSRPCARPPWRGGRPPTPPPPSPRGGSRPRTRSRCPRASPPPASVGPPRRCRPPA